MGRWPDVQCSSCQSPALDTPDPAQACSERKGDSPCMMPAQERTCMHGGGRCHDGGNSGTRLERRSVVDSEHAVACIIAQRRWSIVSCAIPDSVGERPGSREKTMPLTDRTLYCRD